MKKIVSVLLAVTLIFSIISVSAYGETETGYPESQHPVSQNNWSYEIPYDSEYVKVTFSEDTYIPEEGWLCVNGDGYTGDELAGKTIVVSNYGVLNISLEITGDSSGYGFRITEISPLDESEYNIDYFYDGESHLCYVEDLDEVFIQPWFTDGIIYDNKVVSGWKDENGNEYSFYENASLSDCAEDGVATLTPVYTELSIRTDEVFSFSNSSDNFVNGYKMTSEHSFNMFKNYLLATCFNKMALPGFILSVLLPAIYPMIEWGGSCCGFPTAILMQHYGMIDMLEDQGVDSVSELEPTENMTSLLNYYNATTPMSVVCGNCIREDDEDYDEKMQSLYDTVSSGKPVICFINCSYLSYLKDNSLKSIMSLMWNVITGKYSLYDIMECHCIVLSGAYKDADGDMTFIGYDENYATYSDGYAQVYEYWEGGEMRSVNGYSLGNMCWNDDVSYLESFKAEESTNPFAWYSYYSSHNS